MTLLTAHESAALLGLRPHEFYALYHRSQLPDPAINIWFPLWHPNDLSSFAAGNEAA